MTKHFTYIVRCADDTLYTGYTTDVKRRVNEHNGHKKGARYTRARQPVTLVYYQSFETKSLACKEEARIKKLTKKQKIMLIQKTND